MVTLPPERSAEGATILGRGFAEDPAFKYVFPDDRSRVDKLTWLAGRLIRLVRLADGQVDMLDDSLSAVALWIPVERSLFESPSLLIRSGLIGAPFALGPAAIMRLMKLGRPTEKMHSAFAPVPHDYLLQIAVDPARQGRGYGSALLAEGLRRADSFHRHVWLETTNPRNVLLYERHGLKVMDHNITVGDVELTGMLRRANRASEIPPDP